MGCGGRLAPEIVSRDLRSYCVRQRRTFRRIWCGVTFFAVISACHAPGPNPIQSTRVLTIGFPEGGAESAGLGLGQLINILTLEGLTQTSTSIDGRPIPRLAEKWDWENGGRRLRVHLRANVLIHDGTAFTSSVAAEALGRAIARPSNRALYPSIVDIAAIEPAGELQLIIHLSRPSAFLPEDLDLPLTMGAQNVGTGAFRVVRRDREEIELERFTGYYLGTPKIERIIIRPSNNLRMSWSRLLRGEVDMVTDVPPEAVEFIQNDDIQVISYPRSYQFLIAFNAQFSVFQSPAVRRALNSAINRQALVTNVLREHGEPATGPLWPNHWAYDSSIQPFAYDPRNAVAALDAAGFVLTERAPELSRPPSRLRFTCLIPADFSLLERIGLEVQKQLYDVGVDMGFEVVPIEEYDLRIRDGRFEAVLVDMISGPPLARPHLFWSSPRRDGLHAFGYDNPEAGRLFDVLRSSANETAIRSGVSRLQRVLLEDPPALFLAWNRRARAVRRDFDVGGSGRDPLFTIWQWAETPDRQSVLTQ